MEHQSLRQLSLYPLTQHFEIRCVNLFTKEIKPIRDIVYFEYLTKYLRYLKYLNKQGYNVYFFPMPLAAGGCVDFLLDDLSPVGVRELFQAGFTPFYYLETSPRNFQAILRFNTSISDKEEYLAVNRYLVKKYDADSGSLGTEHFFRIAGFTNRKERYIKDGQYPFVKLFISGNVIDKNLLPLELNKLTPTAPRPHGQGKKEAFGSCGCDNYVAAIYRNGGISDISKLDWKVARVAVQKGFLENEIAVAIRKYSPDLESRKAGHVEDYITRTVRKAALSLNNTNIL